MNTESPTDIGFKERLKSYMLLPEGSMYFSMETGWAELITLSTWRLRVNAA